MSHLGQYTAMIPCPGTLPSESGTSTGSVPEHSVCRLRHTDRDTLIHAVRLDRQTDRQTDRQIRQTDRQTDRQYRQTDRHDRQTDRQTDTLIHAVTERHIQTYLWIILLMDNTQCSYILKHCCCTVYYMCIVPGDSSW